MAERRWQRGFPRSWLAAVIMLAASRPDLVGAQTPASANVATPWLSTGPFSLGDVIGSVEDALCLVADAETDGGVVQRVSIDTDGEVEDPTPIEIDSSSGLPPRSFGAY